MADSFQFELVSPERLLVSEAVESVVIPGTEGEMTVMAHHAPVMTTVNRESRRQGFVPVMREKSKPFDTTRARSASIPAAVRPDWVLAATSVALSIPLVCRRLSR